MYGGDEVELRWIAMADEDAQNLFCFLEQDADADATLR